MPWCDECARFFNPPSLGKGGECPTCGRVIGEAPAAPWHFKVLIGASVVYLGFRAVQGIEWLVHRFA
ncbi:MAG: hypothetical protein QOK28_1107 [Actinomycetota bacterium]|jgi:hypothetical protein